MTLDLPAPGSDFLAAPFAPLDEEADAGEGDDVLPEPAAAGSRPKIEGQILRGLQLGKYFSLL